MEPEVYFTGVRARNDRENKINKVRRLFDAAGMGEVAGKGDLATVKVHLASEERCSWQKERPRCWSAEASVRLLNG